MGKRIRHLEYYGYIDQNTYIGLPNVDLSDIREVNREQDAEINAISGATKDKADLSTVIELSGKVDTFIERQSNVNECLANGINSNTERIENLEAKDIEIIEKINEIADKFDPVYDDINSLSDKVDEMDERLTAHLSESSTFEEETNERLDSLEAELDTKISKTEAYDTFAKKSDVYTKEEVDELIEQGGANFATKQWVLDRGYITELDADGKYASKQRLTALEDRVGDIQTTLYNQYNELNSDLTQFKTQTNIRVDTLYERINTLETKHDREIANVNEDISELREDIQSNSNAIYQINNVALPNKADKSELIALSSDVDALSASLDNKVDKSTYENDKARLGVKIESIEENKADKTELLSLSGYVDSLHDELEQEKQDRMESDEELDSRIDETNGTIDEIRRGNEERDQRINALREDLEQEISDRIQGDNDLIGSPDDRDEDNTIYGAKKYADKVANSALLEAKSYADAIDSATRDYIDDTKAELQRDITAKADKTYVNNVRNEIETSFNEQIEAEKNRAQGVEGALESAIRQETFRASDKENIISSALTHTSNVVHALTDWDGDDRADYTDVGNGIVDVMHREVHDLKQQIGSMSLGIKTKNEYEFGIGTYNASSTGPNDSDITVFSIGMGTSDVDRKNAFEVRKDGSIYMYINGEYKKINNLF